MKVDTYLVCKTWHYQLWTFKTRDTKLERFCIKINIPKGNYWILRIGLMGSFSSLQKSEFLTLLIIQFYHYTKIFLILYPWSWNPITGNAILSKAASKQKQGHQSRLLQTTTLCITYLCSRKRSRQRNTDYFVVWGHEYFDHVCKDSLSVFSFY